MEFRVTTVLSADQLIDKAFLRASKVSKSGKNHAEKVKNTTLAKLKSVSKAIESTLKRYEKEFPSFENLPPFYQEVIDIILDTDRLKKSLGALNWARRRIKRVLMETTREVSKSSEPGKIDTSRKKAYARTASFLKQINDDLVFLQEARTKLNSLPDIRTDIPTAVIAGYPNVGKSMLVSKLSTGKPKVAVYPFTTQEVGIGHFMVDVYKCQLIDTPGLLDRTEEERNVIEMQAVSALKHLANLIVFLFDPSGTCGYPLEDQKALADDIRKSFPDVEMIEVANKSDISNEMSDKLNVSALTGENLDLLEDMLAKKIKFIYKEMAE